MGRVFDDPQAVLLREGIDRIQIDRIAGVVHGHDGPGARGEPSFGVIKIDGRRIKARVAGDGHRPGRADGLKRGHKGQRRNQHFRPAAVPKRGLHGQMQRRRPGVRRDDPVGGNAEIGGHLRLETLHFRADAQIAVFADDAMQGGGFGLADDGTGKSHAHVSLRGARPLPRPAAGG